MPPRTRCPICGRDKDHCSMVGDAETARMLRPGSPLYEWAQQFR